MSMSEQNQAVDPASLALADLRAERDSLRKTEDAVSFVRRLAQGRVDLVAAVRASRVGGTSVTAADIVKSGVGPAPSTGSARPPRDTDIAGDHPLLAEFESLCDGLGFDNMADLDDAALAELESRLRAFETVQSEARRRLFDRIDSLTAELVRRYRDGGASVDTLLEG
ncbi:MAG: hypothetical protein EBY80_06955 [Actinobacteria bacterium]|nr:hypothetical protein [Actinomycetota bacterium]